VLGVRKIGGGAGRFVDSPVPRRLPSARAGTDEAHSLRKSRLFFEPIQPQKKWAPSWIFKANFIESGTVPCPSLMDRDRVGQVAGAVEGGIYDDVRSFSQFLTYWNAGGVERDFVIPAVAWIEQR
jgi:hypothetical protein